MIFGSPTQAFTGVVGSFTATTPFITGMIRFMTGVTLFMAGVMSLVLTGGMLFVQAS